MTNTANGLLMRRLRRLAGGRTAHGLTDAELLTQFINRNDEAAFEAIMHRHGAMVLDVARRVLLNLEDAQDVCQAAFLVLARRAACIRKKESLASWLYGVAYRLAMKARKAACRRAERRPLALQASSDPLAELSGRELCDILDVELNRLPDMCRAAWILCHLEGMTRDDAAQQLGLPMGTLKRRLEEARRLLQARLSRRGFALSTVLSVAALGETPAVAAGSPSLVSRTVEAAVAVGHGKTVAGLVAPRVIAMADGMLKVMAAAHLKMLSVAVLVCTFLGGVGVLTHPMLASGGRNPGDEAEVRLTNAATLEGKTPDERIAHRDQEHRSLLGVTLGAAAIAEVEDAGFYHDEREDGVPFRWTNGQARLVVPLRIGEAPRSLQVHLVAARPAGTREAAVRIALNQRPLFDGVISAGSWDRTFDLNETDARTAVTLEIFSDSFVPAEQAPSGGPASVDARRLGVQVKGIRLLAAAEDSPRGAVAPGHALDPGIVILEGEPDEFVCADITADGRTLVSASPDGTVRVFDVANRRQSYCFPRRAPKPSAIAVNFAGKIAVATEGGPLEIMWAHSGKQSAVVRAAGPSIAGLAFSLDSSMLAIASGGREDHRTLTVWDSKPRKERALADPSLGPARTVAYAPHGGSVAAVMEDGTVRVTETNGPSVTRIASQLPARRLAYSSGVTMLAMAEGDQGQVTIYSLPLGRPIGEVQAAGGKAVTGMIFARDDRRLLTVDADGTAMYWDLTCSPARPVGSPRVLPKHLWCGLVLPDRLPEWTGEAGSVRLWRVGNLPRP